MIRAEFLYNVFIIMETGSEFKTDDRPKGKRPAGLLFAVMVYIMTGNGASRTAGTLFLKFFCKML
ncbi:MAG: hypothetical protein CW338_00130 [Clostridiales bacterium]|nr:hypothetical protein [Clostridiales bacterium]